MSYVITGASRGIGLELVKQLLASSETSKVFALSRGSPPSALQALLDKHSDRVVHITCAVDDDKSVQQAAKDVEAGLNGSGLDILINNAGVMGTVFDGPESLPSAELSSVLETNVVGVHRMVVAFLPLLEKGSQKKVISM